MRAAPELGPTQAPEIQGGIARALSTQGWCVTPSITTPQHIEALRAQAHESWKHGQFKLASIGRACTLKTDVSIRGDWILWLPGEAPNFAARLCLEWFETLRLAINQECYLGLFDFEAHFSRYGAGSHYVRHLDRFNDHSGRVVSCVLYLNEAWGEADGGQLRLYLEPDSPRHTDVAPRAGTLVTFLSDRFPHEVLPANRERWSIAGWFRERG